MTTTRKATQKATRGRGRPPNTAATIERRRAEIIEAAYEVFADKGYHAAGIADIAARLDIGHGTFYRYFDNKRDILDHVVDFGVGRFLALVVPDHVTEATTRDELREQLTTVGMRLFTEVVDRDPRLPRMILLEVTAIDAELLQRVLGLLETVAALVSPLLVNGVRRGFLRADLDTEAAARAVTGCVIAGLFALVRSPMSEPQRVQYIDTVVSMICDNVDPATLDRPVRQTGQTRQTLGGGRVKKPPSS